MRFDFWRMAKRMNKVDSKTTDAMVKVAEAIEDLSHSNNELTAIGQECEERVEHYTNVNKNAQEKISDNKKMIEILKGVGSK